MTGRLRTLTIIGLVLVIAFSVLAPLILNNFILNVLLLSITYALLALSINLLTYAGLASLGHAGIMAVSGYALGFVATRTGANALTLAIVAVACGVVAGALFGLLSMRTSGVYFLMATLAIGMVIWGLTMRWTSVTGGENGMRGIERPALFESNVSLYYLALAALIVSLLAAWVIVRSPFGLVLKGVRESETRMRMLGYNPALVKVYVFTLSGLFAAGAGILFVYYNRFISPTAAGFFTSGKAVLMVILGGAGTLAGPIVGALIVTVIENILNFYTPRWPTVLGLLYVFAVFFARDGLVSPASRFLRMITAGRSAESATPPSQEEDSPDVFSPDRPLGDRGPESS